MQWAKQKQTGFTIVELLIVVVVIAILAAITIVAYNGIQQRARQAIVDSALTDVSKKVKMYAVEAGDAFPESLSQVGVSNSDTTQYRYTYDNTVPRTYCVTVISGALSSFITESGVSQSGRCPGHDAQYATNLIPNPSFENNIDGWEAWGGATIERSTDMAAAGTYSLKVTPGPGSESGVYSPWVTLEDGQDYGYRLKARSLVVSTPAPNASNIGIRYTHSAGVNGGGGNGAMPVTANWNNGPRGVFVWENFLNGIPAGSGTAQLRLSIGLNYTNGSTRNPYYIDSATILKQSTTPNAFYFYDGTSPGWMWNGTPHNSSSTGPL